MPKIEGAIDDGHAAAPELPLDREATPERRRQVSLVVHGPDVQRSRDRLQDGTDVG